MNYLEVGMNVSFGKFQNFTVTQFENTFLLINVMDGEMYLDPETHETKVFNHPIHVQNHLKKHYGQYQVI